MKFKRIAGAGLLASLFLFAACTSTPSLTITANWYSNTKNYGGLTGTAESLTYAVVFEPNSRISDDFTAEYETGTYTTTLNDVTVSAANPVNNVPAGFHGYHLHSEFSMTGRYYLKGQKGPDFTDSFTSDVWFLGVEDALRPIYSSKRVTSNIPVTAASSPENTVSHYEYLYEAVYNEELTKVTITQQDLTKEGEPEVYSCGLGSGGTYLDNEQILFALRGLDLSSGFSFRTVNPASKSSAKVYNLETPALEPYTADFSMKAGNAEEQKASRSIDAATLNFSYNGKNPGQSQKAVYARCTNPDENMYRNVMLHLEIEALYSLGTFRYDLTRAVFNEK